MSPNKEKWNVLEQCGLRGQCNIFTSSPPRIALHQVAVIEEVIKGISKNRINSNEATNGEETDNIIIVKENVKKNYHLFEGHPE